MKKNTKYYIAYGSNLNVRQMRYRCPHAAIVGTAELKGWRLGFRGSMTGSYLTIEPDEDGMVPVAVWAVDEEDERALDRYEGYPTFYYKKEITIECKRYCLKQIRKIDAFVYIMHEDRPHGVPYQHYVETCMEGYETFGFDRNILKKAVADAPKYAKEDLT